MRGAARAEASLLVLCRVVTISLKAMRDNVPPVICRPDGAYILGVYSHTGVGTPAYTLTPYGLIKSAMRGNNRRRQWIMENGKCCPSKSRHLEVEK